MFQADLSWAGPEAERVGERRERKSRARDGSVLSRHSDDSSSQPGSSHGGAHASLHGSHGSPYGSAHNSTYGGTQSTHGSAHNSVHGSSTYGSAPASSRASFWSLKKSKSVSLPSRKPSRLSLKDTARDAPTSAPFDLSHLSPALSSAFPPDVASPPAPLLSSSHRHGPTSVPSDLPPHPQPLRSHAVIDEVTEVQTLSPGSYVSRTTTRSCIDANALSPINTETIQEENSAYNSARNSLSHASNSPHQDDLVFSEGQSSSTTSASSHSFLHHSTARPDPYTWKPPTDWDVSPASPSQQNTDTSQLEDLFPSDPDPSELTEFQRFIRRMESAGPRIILDRLKEESPDDCSVDDDAHQEMELERHLWVLTALQLQSMEQAAIPTQGVGPLLGLPTLFRQPKRVLELFSNLGDVYQLSAIYPKSRISYLTTKPMSHPLGLPTNVTPLTVPSANSFPLPYAPGSFNHIRASSLPAILPALALPDLLRDCFRMLAPGGILELRLVDATPRTATMGPLLRAWFEERVLLGLELGFRCSRPTSLMSAWVRKAGFTLLGDRRHGGLAQRLRLPAVMAPGEHDGDDEKVELELRSLVARGLWKDVWGEFARTEERDGDGESVRALGGGLGAGAGAALQELECSTPPCWWWEDEEIVKECWEYGTTVECGTLFAFKE